MLFNYVCWRMLMILNKIAGQMKLNQQHPKSAEFTAAVFYCLWIGVVICKRENALFPFPKVVWFQFNIQCGLCFYSLKRNNQDIKLFSYWCYFPNYTYPRLESCLCLRQNAFTSEQQICICCFDGQCIIYLMHLEDEIRWPWCAW